jgi:hypothetical protein
VSARAFGGAALGQKLRPAPGRYNSARTALLAITAVLVPGALGAQGHGAILPSDVPSFEFPLASPRTSAMVGRVVYASRGESRLGNEWEAEPALGELWPLFALARGRVPVTLHLGSEVYGRYSLGDSQSEQISNDWHVNLILTAEVARWRFALEGYHESSHLGDEYRDRFGVARVDWSRETLGLWTRYLAGPVALSANASWAGIQTMGNVGRGTVALGADYIGKPGRFVGGSASMVAALFAEARNYAGWRSTVSARAGIRFGGPRDRRGFAMLLTYLDGQSTQRQFYLSRSRYGGVEVRFDL